MMNLFKTKVGRLRVIGYLEGISLLALIFIAIPLKYYFGNPHFSKVLGPIHGPIFLLFLFNALSVGVEQSWKFKTTTLKVVLACFVPFETFYIDNKILSKIEQ